MKNSKKIFVFFFIFLLTFCMVGCNKEENIDESNKNSNNTQIEETNSEVDYYFIDKVEVGIEELIEIPKNKNVVPVANDKYNFWISNGIDAKRLFGYYLVDESLISVIIDDINNTRKHYGEDISNYLLIRLSDNEKFFYKEVEGTDKPTVIVRLSSFCSACEDFDFSPFEIVEENKDLFNYIYIMDNTGLEEQIAYMKERNIDLNKVYVVEGSLEGLNVVEDMSTPGLMFISSDKCLRALSVATLLDGEAICSWLNSISDYYFPLDKESLAYAHLNANGDVIMAIEKVDFDSEEFQEDVNN